MKRKRNHVKGKRKRNLILSLIVLVLLSTSFMLMGDKKDNYLVRGDTIISYDDIGIDDLETMSEYGCGLWYSPYVKIYSIGGNNRIAEISNYPRAYKDTSPHVYEKDESFIVTENDLNHYTEKEEWVYMDSKEKIFRVGEKATHYAGDPLSGAFPLWIESENLPFTSNLDKHIFPVVNVPGPIRELTEVGLKVSNTYFKVSDLTFNTVKSKLITGEIVFDRQLQDSDKQIIRIRYKRVFD